MNATQVKYARERAAAIYSRRQSDIKVKHTTDAVTLTPAEKLDALSSGDFVVKKQVGGSYGANYLADFVRFPKEASVKVNTSAINKETAVLTKEYDALIDQLVLGDSEEALKMLNAFAGVSA